MKSVRAIEASNMQLLIIPSQGGNKLIHDQESADCQKGSSESTYINLFEGEKLCLEASFKLPTFVKLILTGPYFWTSIYQALNEYD